MFILARLRPWADTGMTGLWAILKRKWMFAENES
jgi:hypothetical protein